jgi:DNA-binding transcriptional regulator PaaX
MSNLKEKILLLLLGGLAFGYSYTPGKQKMVIETVSWEWKRLNKEKLYKEFKNLYRTRAIKTNKNRDGSYTIVLTEKGRLRALTYYIHNMKISDKEWDGKWRMLVFDIPERIRKGRNALRYKIKELGFYELQKSVFIFPYECKDEIDFIVEFFGLSGYVHYGILESIDNFSDLEKIFKLKK